MDDLFYDRISGESVGQLPESGTIIGRWLLFVPPDKDVFLNSVPVQSGGFLVPELSGNWRVLDGDGSTHQGKISRYQCPEDIEADGIRTMGSHLDELIEADSTWLEWLDVVPLVPGMSDAVDLLPLEHFIRKLFGHIEGVCMKPRAHLHVEVERVTVAKARRLPTKAASYLASHTEDWERPLIRGVLPKRILSEVRHDQIDIYENRVTARLVDHLVVYLNKRIRMIRKMIKVFQDKEDYSRAVAGTYLRQRRILKLWGQSIDANEGRKRAEVTLKELEWLKYRLMGLMDSPLYREVPRRTYVAPTLRTTNILSNDQNYRRVAELWRAWVDAGHAETKTPAEVHQKAQDLCRGIGLFALLLVVRALDQLGYEIRDRHMEAPLKMPGRWELEGHGMSAACVWDEAGRICIEMGEDHLTFLALPASLAAAGDDKLLEEVVNQVLEGVGEKPGRTIVLYAGDSDEFQTKLPAMAQRRIHTVGNDPRTGLSDRVGFLPVSPWDIGSVERVSRALRWFVDSTRFDAYPLVIEVSPGARDLIDMKMAGSWLETGDKGAKLTIRRPPRGFEWELLKIGHLLETARMEHKEAIAEHERLSDELRGAVRKGRTGTLNQQKKNAHQQIVLAKKRLVAVERLHQQLVQARSKTEALLVCPACGTEADPARDFEAHDNGCFLCNCQECRAHWATRLCGKGHRYAVMLPGDFIDIDDKIYDWEDRIYGSDLLALPGRTLNGFWGFVCPTCGEIA